MKREDFPIFKHRPDLIYFDSAATAQKPQVVLDAMDHFYENKSANIHRGPHFLAEEATKAYESARQTIADFINAKHRHEIIFTRNATESINLVARTFGETLEKNDTIVLTQLEHHANIVPWLQLKNRKGVNLEYLNISDDGQLPFDESQLPENTKLICITGMSNAIGTLTPIHPIIEAAKKRNILVLLDASQSIVHYPHDVQELDVDFLVFSGHKLYGPTGIGVLYGKEELLNQMPPFLGGGDMIQEVFENHFTPAGLPNKFEAGTPDIAGAIGLASAIHYLNGIGYETIRKTEFELTEHLLNRLISLPYIRIIGSKQADHRGCVVSFLMDGVHPHDVSEGLSQAGICARSGHHCAQILMDTLKIPATTRFSLAFYNTKDEIDKAVEVLEEIYNYFN